MISTLNQRSNTHNSCEDSFFVSEVDHLIYGCVADGCSTGTKSHFASQALCYIAQGVKRNNSSNIYKELNDPLTSDACVANIMRKLKNLQRDIDLQFFNLLSTCILFEYDKETKTLHIRSFGDGFAFVDGIEVNFDQNNIPDYMAYHLNNVFFNQYISKYPQKTFYNVDQFIITTDGIERIERSSIQDPATVQPLKLLLNKPTSENYLTRMWNLIKRDGFILSDDLTIISYHAERY